MKKLLILSLLVLSACASKPKGFPDEKGTTCLPLKEGEVVAKCWPARLYPDPTRFHYLRPWEEKQLGEMPDLP